MTADGDAEPGEGQVDVDQVDVAQAGDGQAGIGRAGDGQAGSMRDRRDRDTSGKARNARPRDALGRPLPYGEPGIETMPEDLALPPDEALALAQQLLDAGRAFHAHEVLEGTWKSSPDAERQLWQGLAQLAVGVTHVQRGNPVGSVRLLLRAAGQIEPWASDPPHGIDVAGLAAWANALAARVEREGVTTIPAGDLVPILR